MRRNLSRKGDVDIRPRPVVLIAVDTLGGGGAERVALDLARHWPRCHAEPVLVVAFKRGDFVAQLPENQRIIEIGVSSSPRDTISFLRRLHEATRFLKVVGVISHMTAMNRMMLRAAMSGVVRAPVVAVEHNDFWRNQKIDRMPRLRAFLLQSETSFLYRRAHAVVGCSRGVASQAGELFRVPPDRLHAIPNPLDGRFLQSKPMEPSVAHWFRQLARPVFVSVGRLVPQKGFDDMLRAFALQEKGTLIILGEGPLRQTLNELALELGVENRVEMPGFMQAPEQVLQAADLYVSASLWEGYPLTLIEAYASGLPVVARACNFGPEEIVTSDRPGRLVRSFHVRDLAEAMREVVSSTSRFPPATVVNLCENDPDEVAHKYRALFH